MKSQTGGAVIPQTADKLIGLKWARKKVALMGLHFDQVISKHDYERMSAIVDADYYEDESKLANKQAEADHLRELAEDR